MIDDKKYRRAINFRRQSDGWRLHVSLENVLE
jgi:hypothetical protein